MAGRKTLSKTLGRKQGFPNRDLRIAGGTQTVSRWWMKAASPFLCEIAYKATG